MIEAATGMNLVEMKKNRPSCHLMIGRTESAYAAGMASSITTIVDPTARNSEFSRYSAIPRSNTAAYRSRVGVKMNWGGNEAAWPSVLKLVMIIHSTGKKNTSTSTQVSRVIR